MRETTCNAGDVGRPPGGGNGNPLQDSCLENPMGQRSLGGLQSVGLQESDMSERLNYHHNVSRPQKHHAKWEKPDKGDSFVILFLWNVQNMQIYRDKKEIISCQGQGENGIWIDNEYKVSSGMMKLDSIYDCININ